MGSIDIVDRRQLINILEHDISLNFQLALHNCSIDGPRENVSKRYNELRESIFNDGFCVMWPSLYDFTTPFGDMEVVKHQLSRTFYQYNYYYADTYQNYIFTFPKIIEMNGKNYFVGKFGFWESDSVLTGYLFDRKDIPSEFIYGVLTKKNEEEFELVKNPRSLTLKNPLEQEKFYSLWLSPYDMRVLEAVNNDDIILGYYDMIENTKQQYKKFLKQK